MAMSSLTKLNRMHQVLTQEDDKKLSRGEVDALAGFYQGLASRSQATVKPRMIEIYRDSSYAKGQKEFFRNALEKVGFTTEELEGIQGNGAEAFAKLPLDEQFERLQRIGGDWGDGFSVATRKADLPRGAGAAIARGIADFEREYRAGRADDGIDYDFHGENYTTVYLAEGENGRGKELVGYMVELGIYTGDHDVDQMLYFNRKGQYLGNEYHGE
ncbi:MAG: hypothetical protein KC933_38500 [Myxococcales bacterium]|nr:hypothetical protein [Myxococcales bacterium]MCB9649163.1 hypothetical protein [Deltaproteobacteria bacterium]